MWTSWALPCCAALALAASALPARAADELSLGDEAPELECTNWVRGAELKLGDGSGRVRVIEFFNTFDADCAKAVKVLEDVQKEYGAQGLDVVSISTQGPTAVKEFLDAHAGTFRVALDEYDNTNAAYMKGVFKLPHAFVVDRGRRVVWAGEPGDEMKKIVGKVLGGTFDLDAVLRVQKLTTELVRKLQKTSDHDGIAKAADDLLAAEPSNDFALNWRIWIFEQKNDVAGYRAWIRDRMAAAKDDADVLSRVAWRLVTRGDFQWREVEVALDASRRAVELTQEKDADKLDTLARVWFELGMLENAVETEKKAVALDADDEDYKGRLTHYEACLELRKKVEKPAPKPPTPKPPKKR